MVSTLAFHDFDPVIDPFSPPRYEIVPTGQGHDGEDAVRAYCRETRTAFPERVYFDAATILRQRTS